MSEPARVRKHPIDRSAASGDDTVAAALALASSGDLGEAHRRLAESDVEEGRWLLGLLTARHDGDTDATARAARDLLARLNGGRSAGVLRAAALVQLGIARLWRGEFDDAESALQEGGRLAGELGLTAAEAEAAEHGCLLSAFRGRLDEACERANGVLRLAALHGAPRSQHTTGAVLAVALAHWQRTAWEEANRYLNLAVAAEPSWPMGLVASIVKARVAQSERDPSRAKADLATAQRLAQWRRPPRLLRTWLAVAQAEQEILADRPYAAVGLLNQMARSREFGALSAWLAVSEARALIAAGAPARARAVLAPLCSKHEPCTVDAAVEAWLLDAIAADRLGLGGAVCVGLSEALTLAGAEDVRRPFAAAPADLLDRHRDLLRAHPRFADLVSSQQPAQEPARVDPSQACRPPIEPISQREAVVLRYLPTLLTAREIASELYVSPNTVKSQLKSIYRKLDVGSRRDAVERARRLGLV